MTLDTATVFVPEKHLKYTILDEGALVLVRALPEMSSEYK